MISLGIGFYHQGLEVEDAAHHAIQEDSDIYVVYQHWADVVSVETYLAEAKGVDESSETREYRVSGKAFYGPGQGMPSGKDHIIVFYWAMPFEACQVNRSAWHTKG